MFQLIRATHPRPNSKTNIHLTTFQQAYGASAEFQINLQCAQVVPCVGWRGIDNRENENIASNCVNQLFI